MASPFARRPVPIVQIGIATALDGSANITGADYAQAPAIGGQRNSAGTNVVGVRAGRQFLKIGEGGMYAPRTSE